MVPVIVALGTLGPASFSYAGIDAYTWPPSVAQGDSIQVFVSSDLPYDAVIVRKGLTPTSYASFPGLPGGEQAIPDSAWLFGCGWNPSFSVHTDDTWPSGIYTAVLSSAAGSTEAVFVLKENTPGSTSRVLFKTSEPTWQAYNNWGGKSLYDHNSSDNQRSHVVSMKRPMASSGDPLGRWEVPMLRWLEQEGVTVEYAAAWDVHNDPALLDAYDLVLVTGHDEYWSREQRDALEDYVFGFGNLAIFSGNTCWWQIRYSESGDAIICYKDYNLDPLYGGLFGPDNHLVTVKWHDYPVNRPENALTGVSFRSGGYVNINGVLPAEEGHGDYRAQNTDHWVFDNTGLLDGDTFGLDDTIVGYETDGAECTWQDSTAVPTYLDGTPANFVILATSPAGLDTAAITGTATMGIYQWHGKVVNAATTDWAHGLMRSDGSGDPVVRQITRNVLNELSMRGSVGIGGSASPALLLRSAPNPFLSSTRIFLDMEKRERVRIDIYDVGGRHVKRLLDAVLPAGPHVVPWNGTNAWGRQVAGGVYLYVLRSGSLRGGGRTVRVR